MNWKSLLTLSLLLLIVTALPLTVLAQISVGVKQNDWAEYNVSSTGEPMPDHDAEWARMEIDGVEGARVNVTFSSLLTDGTVVNATENLDFESGRLIDYFVIPAGLEKGESFYSMADGNVTIEDSEARTYAGASRTVISGTTVVSGTGAETLWFWDQATGVLVEARSVYPDFTLNTVIDKTDLWEPQIFGLDPVVFYGLVIVAVVVIGIVVVFAVRRKK
jgi:hypothetical protein